MGSRMGTCLPGLCTTNSDSTIQGLFWCQPDLGDVLLLRSGYHTLQRRNLRSEWRDPRSHSRKTLGWDMNSDPTLNPLGSWHMGKGAPSSCESWEGLTCTGMPILCQLVALTAVALIGAIDVGTFLAAAPSLTLIHICGDRVFIIVSPPRLYTGLGWLTSILVWRDFPFEHPLRKVGPGRTLSKGKFSGPRTNQSKAWYCPAGNTQRLELLSHLGTK